VRAGGQEVPDRSPYVTEEEIKIFAEQGVEAGELEEEEKEMIHSILEFTDTVVREVMVPRIDITAVDIDSSLEQVLEAILKEGHSRIPVYEGSIDNIIGILHARDVLNEIARAQGILYPHRFGDASPGPARPGFSLRQMRADNKLRAPYFIPENKKISELLKELRMSKTPIAIVVDEYGGTAGLVTIEDLLEEIVGEIMDEWDVEEEMIRPVDENCVIFDARVPVEDVNETLSVDLPDDEFETIGGFVFGLFGKLPSAGDTIEYKDLSFTVEKADSHRIMEVRACRTPREDRSSPTSEKERPRKPQTDDQQSAG
ncbi:MAG: hemolysin family protein, partial [Armatimonadota bacterium]